MGLFSAEQYASLNINETSEARDLLIAGEEYDAIVSEVKTVLRSNKEGNETPVVDIKLTVEVPYAQQANVGRDTIDLTDSVWLETTASGEIDMGKGKNFRMKEYRDATNNNVKGKPFNFEMLAGHPVRVVVGRYTSKKNGKDYESVKGVARP